MNNELSPEEYQAVKNFAGGLKEVFVSYKNNHPDALTDILLNFVIKTIDIHLQLKELEVERYLLKYNKAK